MQRETVRYCNEEQLYVYVYVYARTCSHSFRYMEIATFVSTLFSNDARSKLLRRGFVSENESNGSTVYKRDTEASPFTTIPIGVANPIEMVEGVVRPFVPPYQPQLTVISARTLAYEFARRTDRLSRSSLLPKSIFKIQSKSNFTISAKLRSPSSRRNADGFRVYRTRSIFRSTW